MGFKIPRINPARMPRTIRTSRSPIGGQVYRGGLPNERAIGDDMFDDYGFAAGPARRDPLMGGGSTSGNAMGKFGTGERSVEKPGRLEVRRSRRPGATSTERYDVMDELEISEGPNVKHSVANLRRLLARKGTTYKPTGGNPYALKGGDLGVPSFGVDPKGYTMSAKEQLKMMKANKAYRGAR